MTKIAAIQMCSGTDPVANAATFEALVRKAHAGGAVYVQSPEMTGAVQRDREGLRAVLKDQAHDLIFATAARLAKELGLFIHVGSTAIALPDGKIANRAFLFGRDGALMAHYDKIHMFDVDLDKGESWRESAVYRPGETATLADTPFGKLGFAICYDVRFPQLFRAEALAGAEIIAVPAAFTKQTGEAHWHVLLRARAIENGVFIIAAAQAGLHQDGRETYGHSMIIDPWGRIIAEAGGTGEAVIMAEIDLAEVAQARAKIPNLKNARNFDVAWGETPTAGGEAA